MQLGRKEQEGTYDFEGGSTGEKTEFFGGLWGLCFFFQLWSPPQNHKFFEFPKKLCLFPALKKNRVPRVPKKTLVFFPVEPPSKSQVPSCSFLPSCKGAITCHFSVGLGRKEFKKFLNSCFKKLVILRGGSTEKKTESQTWGGNGVKKTESEN